MVLVQVRQGSKMLVHVYATLAVAGTNQYSAARPGTAIAHQSVAARGVRHDPVLLNVAAESGEELGPAGPKQIHAAKSALMRTALLSGRGVWARPSEREAMSNLVEHLERSSHENHMPLVDGTWELIASDVEPFRASTFFLALGEAVEANIQRGASDGALTVHSLATGGGEVGRVAHVIEGDGSVLHSLVELKSGSLPSLPVALTGTVISSAEVAATDTAGTFAVALKNTTVQESTVRYGLPSTDGLQPGADTGLMSWIGDELVSSGAIFEGVLGSLGGAPVAQLRLAYADDEMLIWRAPNLSNHYFVFARGDEASWPALGELKRRQAADGVKRSPIGSAFAFGMLNPFFSRAAGLRR